MSFADRTAIVAGGSTGIGLAAVLRLLQGAARVAICSHDEATLAPALAQLEGQGEALAVRADVTSSADMHRLVEAAEEAFGGIDHLVFAAGIQTYGTVVDTPEEVWEPTLAVNLKGAFLAAKHAVPAMIARGAGAPSSWSPRCRAWPARPASPPTPRARAGSMR
jgi:NAD(P)-dependent dehydrogenase (short-subunit alcohol dehydrogenase family)